MKTKIKNFYKNNVKIILSGEKCIKNLTLNILGLQVFRYVLSKLFYLVKKKNYIFFEINDLYNNGIQVVENILDKEEFKKIENEYCKLIEDYRFSKRVEQGSGKIDDGIEYKNVIVDESLKDYYPSIYNLKNNSKILKYFKLAEKKENINIYIRLEEIKIIDDKLPDPQKSYHYDTFHNTFKGWIFINDVELKDGPFHYIKKSHLFSTMRAWNEWKNSIRYCLKNISSSFRYPNHRKKTLDQNAFKTVINKNNLIIANTHGLHRRGDGKVGSTRKAIQIWTRENPFKIFI